MHSTVRDHASSPSVAETDYNHAVLWLSAALSAAVFLVPSIPFLYGNTDLRLHIDYAAGIHGLSDIISPHFLFQLLLLFSVHLSGATFEESAIVLIALSYAGMAAVISSRLLALYPKAHKSIPVLMPTLILIMSHVFIFTILQLSFYKGYVVPTLYYSATQPLSKALSVCILFLYFRAGFAPRDKTRFAWVLPPLIILSALAKPSFLIAFVPTVALVEFGRFIFADRKHAVVMAALVLAPAVLVLAAQSIFTYGQGGSGGIGIEPFLVYGGWASALVRLPGSVFFPVVATLVLLKSRPVNNHLAFTWLLYFVGMLISFCLVETGHRMMHGNFGWTGQTVTFLLYVECTIALITMPARSAWPAWLAFAAHVGFGVVWYLAPFFIPSDTYLFH